MKRLKSILILLVLIVFLFSCAKKPPVNYIWTGQEEFRSLVPACIIWYKKLPDWAEGAWRPYKAFSQNDANDMRKIIQLLWRPEIKAANPNLQTEDKLSLIFYNGRPENLIIREVYFEIKDKTFICATGKSKRIAEILLNRPEIDRIFYWPCKELPYNHYDDKSFESLKYYDEEFKKEQAGKEAKKRRKISEANQAK